jgi:hypothetical protein
MRYALPRPEILAYPLETNVIDSVVLNASGVAPDMSGPYIWRRYLLAGTVLSQRPDNTYEQYTGISAGIATGQVQTLTFVGPPSGGSFAVAIQGNATDQIAYPTDAPTLQAMLEALSLPVGPLAGLVTVSGPVPGPSGFLGSEVYTVAFDPTLGEPRLMTTDPTNLTGPGTQDLIAQIISSSQPAYTQNVAGVLFDTVEFADGTYLSDEPVAMLRRNVSFQASKIVNFAALNASGAIVDALPTCEFV